MAVSTPSTYRALFYPSGRPAWSTPELFRLHKLPQRATFRRFSSPTSASSTATGGDREISLDGEWDFQWCPSPEDALQKLESADARGSVPLQVPGSWQVQGLAHPERGWDRPHYTNIQMPIPGMQPPVPPAANPSGIFRRRIEIPASWDGWRTVLHFGGADNTLLVFLDGHPVGLSKDSRLPAEFDITPLVRAGAAHRLEAVVIKYSDSTYIEDQDHWWLSGLHRSVYLQATPPVHLANLLADARLLEDNHSARLDIRAEVGGGAAAEGAEVEITLHDGARTVVKPVRAACTHRQSGPMQAGRGLAEFHLDLPRVQPWSAESPRLYELTATLRQGGRVLEATRIAIGFKRIEIQKRQLLVNGQPVMIHGVNRHDHHESRGKALARADMELDVLTMKRHNINAVRCSHYPNDPQFLDLCDRHGLYVIDEANIEAHAFYHECCADPRYLGAFLDRVSGMVQRDRNHACIIAWSLGNESGYGPNHDAAAGWVRSTDPSRPVHYEGALCRGWEPEKSRATDIVCPMYASIEQITRWAKDPKFKHDSRPLILCEYSHAMGNSNGCLADYYRAFETVPGLQGGFIWEWIDHALVQPLPDGRTRWAYGGDFGDTPSDFNFVCDGLVWPDRTPHPAMQEFKYLARPVALEAVDVKKKTLTFRNKRFFTGLDDLAGTWQIVAGGVVVEQGRLPAVPAAPRGTAAVRVPWRTVPEGGAWLQVRFQQKRATAWAPAGHLVAWDEASLPATRLPVRPAASRSSGPAWEAAAEGAILTFRCGNQELEADPARGLLLHWTAGGQPVLASTPELSIWRAPTDNDGIKLELAQGTPNEWHRQKPLWRWMELGLDRTTLHHFPARCKKGPHPRLEFRQEARLPGGKAAASLELALTLLPGAGVRMEAVIRLPKTLRDIPRAGLRLMLPQGWEHVRWFGRGPWENYPDRNASALHGIYENTVHGECVPYIMPQEHGLKTGVRWVELAHFNGARFRAQSARPLAFSALHARAEAMTAATHREELAPVAETVLSLDAAHRGLGTMSCGPDTLDHYRLLEGEYRLDLECSVEEPA